MVVGWPVPSLIWMLLGTDARPAAQIGQGRSEAQGRVEIGADDRRGDGPKRRCAASRWWRTIG